MKLRNKAKTTSASSEKTSPTSAQPWHANKQLLVDADGLSLKLGNEQVLEGVSFCIHQGEFIGLIGPNGAGKTTLLKILLGLQRADAGQARITARRIGYIPQRGSFAAGQVPISVREVASLGSPAGAMQALQDVGLAKLAGRNFAQLSGGQQQRVLIAKALATNPDLLMLDEPTTGIDERSQTEFYHLLGQLQNRGIAIVMVSHDIDTVLRLVTRVICLNRTVLYDGPPEHFEADKYLPRFYTAQHRLLHHQHGEAHA